MPKKRGKPAEPVCAAAAAAPALPARKRRRLQREGVLQAEAGFCFTFGTNGFGALGLGDDVLELPRPAHVDVDGKRLLAVACGGMHSAALTEDGAVYTWGVNDEGALGRATAGSAWDNDSNAFGDATRPGRVRVPGEPPLVQVVAGDGFTFALADDGAVYGWGSFRDDLSAFAGFVAAGSSSRAVPRLQRTPALVYRPPAARDAVRKLAAGARHVVALTRRGEVLTWGIGGQGQLGRLPRFQAGDGGDNAAPDAATLLTPAAVPGVAAALGTAADIAAGAYATFVLGANGSVAAWGLNNAGQLGLPLAAEGSQDQCVWSPTLVPGLSDGDAAVTAVAGGEHHTLALTRSGRVLSFGRTDYGMLGRPVGGDNGAMAPSCLPEPAVVAETDGLADERAVALAAGTHVSGCVTAGGQLYLWGCNVSMQLAKGGDDSDGDTPARMRRHKAFGVRRVLAVSFGGQHAALLASDVEQP